MTKYLLYNSRLVRPEMEKPDENNYCEITGSGIRLFNRGMYSEAISAYAFHLCALPGIECSEELLAKWKDGDELIEGKDFATEPRPVCHGRHSTMELVAVPVQSDEEDVLDIPEAPIHFNNEESYAWIAGYVQAVEKIKSQYKLTKR